MEGVIIDNGGCTIQAGFAGEDAPRCIMSAVTGRPYTGNTQVEQDIKDFYVGDEAQNRRSVLNLDYPIERGIIKNWDDVEKIWDHVLHKELRISSQDLGPVMITEPPLNPKSQRERAAQIMFESIGTPSFYVALVPMLAVYACGRVSAISLHVGDGVTHVDQIYEGYNNESATRRLDFAGKDLTEKLRALLHERGYDFSTSSELEMLREIKEKKCYVAQDYEQERTGLVKTQEYSLPDGNVITIGNEMFECTEALFKPIKGLNCGGIQHLIKSHLDATDIDCRPDLYCNIILTGATTLFPGFPERLKKELRMMVPTNMRLNVIACPERKLSVWIGGSILGSLSTFQYMWVSKQEYEEYGPTILNRRAF